MTNKRRPAAGARRRRQCRSVLAITVLASLVACSRGQPDEPATATAVISRGRPSIFLMTLDTTRADHLEPYGAEGSRTPALAGLAADGIVFEHATAVAPLTAPSHASMLTGLYPPRHGVRNNLTHFLPETIPTLAEWLSAAGYKTAAFVSAFVLKRRYGLDQGFAVYDDDLPPTPANRQKRMETERTADVTTDRALAWLDSMGGDEPFFLWVHYYDPHLPLTPPSPWAEEFPGRPYDAEIAFMDSQIGRLLEHPRVGGEGVAIIAMGDHGEGLGDHGEQTHGLLVYDSTLHVPWIMRLPGGPSGVRIASPVSQVDLVPTIRDLVDADPGPGAGVLEGRSLLPMLEGEPDGPARVVFSESEAAFSTYGWARLRTARQGALKYIDAPVEELYDLRRDPNESRNLAADRPDDVRRLAAEAAAWASSDSDAQSTVAVDSETAEQLRAIGYIAGDPGRPQGEGRGNPVELIGIHEEIQSIHGLQMTGQFEEAVRRVRAVLDKDPENLAALRDLSHGLLELGRLDEAAETAAQASAVAPWSAQALQIEADVEHRRGHHERALELIDDSLALNPRLQEALLDRARYLAALGRMEEAKHEIEPLIVQSADDPWVALRYAEVVEIPAGDFRAAEGRLREVLERDPYLVEGWLLFGKMLVTAGRASDAASVYREAIAYRPDHVGLKARLALLLAESGDPTAEEMLREVIRMSPTVRADLHVALGERLAARGRRDEAREQYEIAAGAPTFSAGTVNAKAMALLRIGQTSEAESLWRQLTRDRPEYGRAWLNLASLSIQRREWSHVEELSRAAVEREPHSAAAWSNLGIGLEELGRTAEAESAYRRAGEVDATDWRGLFNLGLLLRKSARYGEAASVQQEVLARSPSNPGAHFELGMLYAGPLADLERAKVHLLATIQADPNHPRARQAQTVLDRMP